MNLERPESSGTDLNMSEATGNPATESEVVYSLPERLRDATPSSVIAAAMAMREDLRERQEETEALTYYPEATHQAFEEAGFYRIMQPRRFGGLEFDVATFYKVIIEVARGCPSTGWCLSLNAAHTLQMSAMYNEDVQRRAYGPDGDFRMSGRDTPLGTATEVDGGYVIDGTWNYCSGSPWSNWIFLGARLTSTGAEADMTYSLDSGHQVLAVVQRAKWERLDDWHHSLGLKGSGSHSVRVDNQFVPADQVVRVNMLDISYPDDFAGASVNPNPMYSGRQTGFFGGELASIAIGTAKAALDEYERLIRSKKTTFAPHVIRASHADFQITFGKAMGMIAAAEAIVLQLGHEYMELSRRQVEEGVEFTHEDDIRLDAMAIQAARLAWEAMEDLLVRTAGSAPLANGQRMQRYVRDFLTYRGHQAASTYETMARYLACLHLGEEFER